MALEAAEKAGADRVLSVDLCVGEQCGYLPESIELYFSFLAEGTCCEGAVLCFERLPALLRCQSCGQLFERKPFSFACPRCGGDGAPTEYGREFYVKSIELEEAE